MVFPIDQQQQDFKDNWPITNTNILHFWIFSPQVMEESYRLLGTSATSWPVEATMLTTLTHSWSCKWDSSLTMIWLIRQIIQTRRNVVDLMENFQDLSAQKSVFPLGYHEMIHFGEESRHVWSLLDHSRLQAWIVNFRTENKPIKSLIG